MPSAIVTVSSMPRRGLPRARVALFVAALLLVALPVATLAADTPVSTPSTEVAALQIVLDEGMAAIAALETQAQAACDERRALEMQAGIVQAKADLQRRLLEVQLEWARRDGRAAKAVEIEGVLARMKNPPAGEPQTRPVPSAAPSAR